MATEFTDYPEALDAFTNPVKFDQLDTVNAPHHVQESQQNDAIEALEALVGTTVSPDPASVLGQLATLTAVSPTVGTGSPEGVVTGDPGRIYFDITDVDAIAMWVKATGTGDTGWKQQTG